MTTRYALIYVYYSLILKFLLFQEHDKSIMKVERFLREQKQYDLKCVCSFHKTTTSSSAQESRAVSGTDHLIISNNVK